MRKITSPWIFLKVRELFKLTNFNVNNLIDGKEAKDSFSIYLSLQKMFEIISPKFAVSKEKMNTLQAQMIRSPNFSKILKEIKKDLLLENALMLRKNVRIKPQPLQPQPQLLLVNFHHILFIII